MEDGRGSWGWGLPWRQGKTAQSCIAAAAKSFQSCPILCDPIDSSPPGSPVPGILQARTLEWVAISFSNAGKWKVKSESEVSQSCLTAAHQAPPSMGFSGQQYWSGVPSPLYLVVCNLIRFIYLGPPPTLCPLGTTSLFSLPMSPFLFCYILSSIFSF